ncbi:hypothetical protein AX774_g705 [Zancudomyces culisetae]|uniref:Uncharacterized protein n=1 Tax=Zancudomyces culisetae TaxID=1213189 RepID=A0A1R1PXQ7_ZANCU|nr:hypothetical protein AX774_g705 [Zancudomyces culisetae]|eukprot:OMH85740.1 hypothetical protein AX774_g705 [Zancudomyces culisetae]
MIQTLDTPIEIILANNKPASHGLITTATVPLEIMINKHTSTATFNVVPSLSYPVILGLPWLKQQQPIIDWVKLKLNFNLPESTATNNLKLNQITLSEKSFDPNDDSEDEDSFENHSEKLPMKYQDYSDTL